MTTGRAVGSGALAERAYRVLERCSRGAGDTGGCRRFALAPGSADGRAACVVGDGLRGCVGWSVHVDV